MATNVKVIHLHYSWLSPPVKLEQATYLYKTITHEFHDRNLLSFLEFYTMKIMCEMAHDNPRGFKMY
jgi:hypothetical protein